MLGWAHLVRHVICKTVQRQDCQQQADDILQPRAVRCHCCLDVGRSRRLQLPLA
jgi:hypothetical protein